MRMLCKLGIHKYTKHFSSYQFVRWGINQFVHGLECERCGKVRLY